MRAKLEARDRDRVVMPSRSARARASRPGTPPASNCAAPAELSSVAQAKNDDDAGVGFATRSSRRADRDSILGIFLLRVASRVLFFFSSRSID
jgi:hypothetical protein